MHYGLGVDLGTTFTAAAVSGPRGTRMVPLGTDVVTPSVVFAGADGRLLTGEAGESAGEAEPTRLSRGHKRRLGDPTPLVIGGAAYSPAALLAAQLRDVLAAVTAAEGVPPGQIVLTCPAVWGPYRREHFDEVPQLARVRGARVVTEPEAAATHYAVERRLGDGELIAVYDLGGGTFDSTILRARPGGMEILGSPEGIERLGGMDFDDALLANVDSRLDGAISALDPADPSDAIAAAAIRAMCVRAKEDLSIEPEVTLRVPLPSGEREVLITRLEFNDMIRPSVALTTEALDRTIASAGLRPQDLAAVLLAGGSSRTPLVPQMVSAAFGRPVRVSLHPKFTVALGAAAIARASAAPAPPPPVAPPATPPSGAALPAAAPVKRRPRWLVPVAAAAALVIAAGTVFALTRGDDESPGTDAAGVTTTTTVAGPPVEQTRVFDGEDVQPFKSIIGSEEEWTGTHLGADRAAAHNAIAVAPGELDAGQAGLAAKWTGTGAGQLYFQDTDGGQDMSAMVADGALVFDVVVRTPPASRTTIAAHCTFPCAGVVEGTSLFASLPVGTKSTVRIPLTCFVEAGLDPKKVDTFFLVHTEGAFDATFGAISWSPAEQATTSCADLT